MEQFVLGIFQEQLSRFIVGFRKEQVNANLLNGKGEIRDVELNCETLNQALSVITPLIELQSVTLSKLSFHVTSWTNIRKAPILVDVEHVTATLVEPLTYTDTRASKTGGKRRRRVRQITQQQLLQLIQQGVIKSKSSNTPYSLLDRIIDNLTIEVASVNVTFQPRGRFKTTRPGPWTPPALHLQLAAVRVVSVNEYGHEAPPAEIWKHNHQHHHKSSNSSASTKGCFLIYKKIEMEYRVALRPHRNQQDDIPLISGRDNKVCVHVAMKRRVRDGEWMAVQLDATIPKVEIDIPQHAVPVLAHALAGVEYCIAKDRAFDDPLKPVSLDDHGNHHDHHPVVTSVSSAGESYDEYMGDDGVLLEEEDEDSSSSSYDEEDETEVIAQATSTSASSTRQSSNNSAATSTTTASPPRPSSSTTSKSSAARYALPAGIGSQPVLILPTGLMIHEKLSISFSIHHASVRGTYASKNDAASTSTSDDAAAATDGHFVIVSKGVVAEAIWPKTSKEKGGYVQASVSYLNIKEQCGSRVVTLVSGGVEQHDMCRPLEQVTEPLPQVKRDETFPLFEDRVVRPDPVGLRHSFPAQAFGLKTTVEFVEKLSTSDSDIFGDEFDDNDNEEIRVVHDVGIDRFNVVADSVSWCRILQFAVNEQDGDGCGFDPRWHSGNWIDCISPDMLLPNPSGTGHLLLNLDECIQPKKQLFLDENEFISSDLFNLTARVTNIDLRIPAAAEKDIKSCSVVVRLDEVMMLVSSALPRTMLSGKIGTSVYGDDVKEKGIIQFPNDDSDVAYVLERSEDPSNRQRGIMTTRAISTFRAQLTYRGFSVRLVPVIPFYVAKEPQQLLAPTELTMIVCFEGEPPESAECNLTKLVLFTSVEIYRLEVNMDLDLLAAALITLLHHAGTVKEAARSLMPTLSNKSQQPKANVSPATTKDGKIRKSFRGRRVLVQKQMSRSRDLGGGLSLAIGLQIADLSFRVWRQFVPCTSPLRSFPPPNGHNGQSSRVIPLVQVLRCEVKGMEFGVEATLRKQHRRVVLKTCISEIEMKVCDLAAAIDPNSPIAMDDGLDLPNTKEESENSAEAIVNEPFMATLVHLGSAHNEKQQDAEKACGEYAIALRCEEHMEDVRCWSFAADVANGGVVNCRPEEIESLAVLIFEALLMPAMSRFDQTALPFPSNDSNLFPVGTIGWFLESILPLETAAAAGTPDQQSETSNGISLDGASDGVSVKYMDMVLRELMRKVVPDNVETLLCRAQICDMLISVAPESAAPLASADPGFGLHLESVDFVATYLPSRLRNDHLAIFDVVARKGEKWSSVVGNCQETGLKHRLAMRQSLRSMCMTNDAESPSTSSYTGTDLVPPFGFSYSYAKSRASVSMTDALVMSDMEKLDEFLYYMLNFSTRCERIAINMSNAVGTLKGSQNPAADTPDQTPVEISSSTTAVSFVSLREALRKLNERLVTQDYNMKNLLSERNQQLESMRLMVFTKEKERAGALALVSSQATGWLRIGDSARTGQRGEITATLWPYWAILRRGLLIIYQGPGQYKPLDVIPLQSASLRQLSGGQRKRDLKRAFALVQSSGMVRLIVVGSDNEYHSWIRELRRSIDSFSSAQDMRDSTHSGVSAGSVHSFEDFDTEPIDDEGEFGESSPNQGRSIGKVSFSRAVRAAQATKQAVVDRSRRKTKDSDDVIATGIDEDAISQTTDPSSRTFVPPLTSPGEPLVSSPGEEPSDSGSRRQNVRNRVTGVGQATKTRFGSAFEIARQKGREVAERRRMRTGSASEDDTNPQRSDTALATSETMSDHHQWSCSACTFLNPGIADKCEMCESERASSNVITSIDEEPAGGKASEMHEKEEGASFTADPVEPLDGSTSGRVGVRQRFGAAVRSRLSTRDAPNDPARSSGRFNLSRRSNSVQNDGFDPPDSIKLRNVVVGGTLPTPMHPFGDDHTTGVDLPLKRLEGRWFVGVESRQQSGQSDAAATNAASTNIATTSEANLNTSSDSVLDLDQKDGGNEVHKTSEDETNNIRSVQRELPTKSPSLFHIQVFKYVGPGTESKPASTITRSLSEVLALHAELSESIMRIPRVAASLCPLDEDGRLPNGDMKPSLAAALGLTALDAVRISGALLGGLLGTQSEAFSPTPDSAIQYQVDVVSEFLNSMIDAELPIDGLQQLADFLEITNVSTETAQKSKCDTRKKSGRGTSALDEARLISASNDIHSLLSICQGEILQAETHSAMSQHLAMSSPVEDKPVLTTEGAAPTPTPPPAATATAPIRSLLNELKSSFIHPGQSSADRFHQAMHAALIKVMEERDESLARLVAADVLHAHELERQKQRADRLETELHAVRRAAVVDGKIDARKEAQERERMRALNEMQDSSDEELVSLCRQLSVEISARTSTSLEVTRLQESRRMEREREEAEKAALMEQVQRLQEELARERAKNDA